MRGGTSKGLYFHEEDLPNPGVKRDRLLQRLMGSPDVVQIDGFGGSRPITSKVAIVSRAQRNDADVDYTFAQVEIDEDRVIYTGAVGLLDAQLKQFSNARVNADDVWSLIGRIAVCHEKAFDVKPHTTYTTRVTNTYKNGSTEQQQKETPTGGTDHPLSNAEIVAKFLKLAESVIEKERSTHILDIVLGIDRQKDTKALLDLLNNPARNALA